MSEAPETIWTCNHVGEYGRHFPEAVEAEGEYGGTAVSYRRADLPPTLSAAMELPEVKALVNALTLVARAHDLREFYHALPNDRHRIGEKRSPKGHAREAWLRAFRKSAKAAAAALAAIKEPKP